MKKDRCLLYGVGGVLVLVLHAGLAASLGFADEGRGPYFNQWGPYFNQSEELAQTYLDALVKSGVPTSSAAEVVLHKAQVNGTIELWEVVASLANSYAHVVGVLRNHYADLSQASKSGGKPDPSPFMTKATQYERTRNHYIGIRNDAYIELARLYLAKDNKAKALSYLLAAVRLSAPEPNTKGEALIRQIIEYPE